MTNLKAMYRIGIILARRISEVLARSVLGRYSRDLF